MRNGYFIITEVGAMRKRIIHLSKSTVSVILTLCMLVSCVTVGLIATDAAQDGSESVGANKTIYINTEKWGDDVDTVAYYAWAWKSGSDGS